MSNIYGIKISNIIINKYFDFFTEIVLKYYYETQERCFLPGHIEVDETKISEKSFEKLLEGLVLPLTSIIGFRERISKLSFLCVIVENRSENIFLELLLKHINFASSAFILIAFRFMLIIIRSHCSQNFKMGYIHYFNNHSVSFVTAFFSNIHTNGIERM